MPSSYARANVFGGRPVARALCNRKAKCELCALDGQCAEHGVGEQRLTLGSGLRDEAEDLGAMHRREPDELLSDARPRARAW